MNTAMTDESVSGVARHDVGTGAGGGHAAPGPAAWLGRAAAPTFAIMALWTAFSSGRSDMAGMAMQGSSPASSMTMMYVLMSIFHAGPWLKLISGRCNGTRSRSA